jgi:hypothetical protein
VRFGRDGTAATNGLLADWSLEGRKERDRESYSDSPRTNPNLGILNVLLRGLSERNGMQEGTNGWRGGEERKREERRG